MDDEPIPAEERARWRQKTVEKARIETAHHQCACCHQATECIDDGGAWICADAVQCKANEQAIVREPVKTVTMGGKADDFETALDAALDARPAIRFPRNARGMQQFVELVEMARPLGLGLDADARKAALGGMTVNRYMTVEGWQDDPAALDRVWTLLEQRVLATEAAEVAATE